MLLLLYQNTHLSDQVTMRLISQLIKVISYVLQKLLKYFSGTIHEYLIDQVIQIFHSMYIKC